MKRATQVYNNLPKSQQVDVRRGRAGSSGLWQMLIALEKDRSSGEKLMFWADLLIAMTNSYGYSERPFGAALAACDWSEMRLNQLLSAGPDTVLVELRRVGQYLKSNGQKANWNDAKNLAYATCFGDEQDRKKARLRIAQSYYITKSKG